MNLQENQLLQVNPTEGERYYLNEDRPFLKYASVTSILSATQSDSTKKAIDVWRKSLVRKGEDPKDVLKKAALRGTEIHEWTDEWLSVRDPGMSPHIAPWCHYIKKAPFWNYVDEVLCTEQKVYSDKSIYPYAGTFDALLRIKNKVILFDLKTKNPEKKYPTKQVVNEALCQLQAYRLALKENQGINVDRLVAFYAFPDQPVYLAACSGKDLKEHEESWLKRLAQYAKIKDQNHG